MSRFRHLLAWAVAGAPAYLAASAALAAYHTFQISQVFSNADGSIQYVVLREAQNAGGQNFLAGQMLTASKGAVMKTLQFPTNLPSTNTSGRRVLIATSGFAAQAGITPDYTMPDRFVPTDGGTLDYAGADTIDIPPLPFDGVSAVDRGGNRVANSPVNFAGNQAALAAAPVRAVEFFHSGLNHFFISALAPDIDALDSGRLAGWMRTGLSFKVYPSAAAGGAGANPVCRILIPPPADSHFFSASPQECSDTIAKFPQMVQETTNAFYIALPATAGPAAGSCPTGTIPVYRVFNNRADGNHRYTTDPMIRDLMVGMGGIAEGYGADAVIMCAPA